MQKLWVSRRMGYNHLLSALHGCVINIRDVLESAFLYSYIYIYLHIQFIKMCVCAFVFNTSLQLFYLELDEILHTRKQKEDHHVLVIYKNNQHTPLPPLKVEWWYFYESLHQCRTKLEENLRVMLIFLNSFISFQILMNMNILLFFNISIIFV